MVVVVPDIHSKSIVQAYEDLYQSSQAYISEGLLDRDICRAIYPKCMIEQEIATKVMKGIGVLFNASSKSNVQLTATIDERLENRIVDKRLMGVVSIEPKSLFSLEMLLRIQNENIRLSKSAQKVSRSFKKLILDVASNNPKAMSSFDVYMGELKAFTMTLL